MNILLINHYAGSVRHGMEFRPYYLAREWVRSGHRVRIAAGSYSHVRSRQPDLRPGPGPTRELLDGIEYLWYPTPTYGGNGLGRVRNIASFLRQMHRDAKRHAQEFAPDVVIASSTYPMDIWVAQSIARRAGARLVFEVHDLWPLSPIELGGMSRWHPFIMLCQLAEDHAYRAADATVSILPKVGPYMASRGLDLTRLHVVGNGVAVEDWEGADVPVDPAIEAWMSAQRAAGRTVIGFAGSHGVPNALDVVLDAAKLLADEPVAFMLVGDGMEKAMLARRVSDEGIANVRMFPPVPKAQIPSLLRRLDIAYIGWRRLPIYRFGIAPNKLMDYMMAGCAVLHSVEAGNDPVQEAGCGLSVEPESAQAVADGVKRMVAVGADERARMGRRGREFILRHHTYQVLARRFLEAATGQARAVVEGAHA
ncbi:MAG: glycosyltransferase family 4 protein [Proteobacteria bacterium]|nr:glycosyltransferase family 4 protein [Pseudomonadota bacterium]